MSTNPWRSKHTFLQAQNQGLCSSNPAKQGKMEAWHIWKIQNLDCLCVDLRVHFRRSDGWMGQIVLSKTNGGDSGRHTWWILPGRLLTTVTISSGAPSPFDRKKKLVCVSPWTKRIPHMADVNITGKELVITSNFWISANFSIIINSAIHSCVVPHMTTHKYRVWSLKGRNKSITNLKTHWFQHLGNWQATILHQGAMMVIPFTGHTITGEFGGD